MLSGKRILVMGLLDPRSLAWAIGSRAAALGAEVLYTAQSERLRDVLLRRAFAKSGLDIDDYPVHACDVTRDEEIAALFARTGPLDGLVHSIAYAKPETCLGEDLAAAPRADVLQAFEISAASLAFVAREARKVLRPGAGIVALSFDALHVYPGYNWMGVCKAALEAVVRYLARDLGAAGVRVNCISAGPQETRAASYIPGFQLITEAWPRRAPAGWDPERDRAAVADAAAFLLSGLARRITGEVLFVDGGYHAIGLDLLPGQMPPPE
ncbi:MAG: SDR family oxidoreductase [Armatimonadetes bacterium]|nr:SDR family oxidoreductase [Armatimonadota bacterium]